jgi:hypothetical protein
MNGYIDAMSEKIQNSELARVSREAGVTSLDLSGYFHRQHGDMPISEQFALGYFLQNIEDNVHFTYRGNEWIADRMFLGFHDEFAKLGARGDGLVR